ncbi:MAG: hypothetical protein K9K38_02905 [Rhodoferax sp.]|nr:hypothetical protein [Rhodoferax sp.]
MWTVRDSDRKTGYITQREVAQSMPDQHGLCDGACQDQNGTRAMATAAAGQVFWA